MAASVLDGILNFDLMAALKKSLAQMGSKKKGPQRVEATQEEPEVEVKHERGKRRRAA